MPIGDVQVAQDVFGLVGNFNLGTVADEFGGCTTVADDVKQGVDELLLGLEPMTVRDKRLGADAELGHP